MTRSNALIYDAKSLSNVLAEKLGRPVSAAEAKKYRAQIKEETDGAYSTYEDITLLIQAGGGNALFDTIREAAETAAELHPDIPELHTWGLESAHALAHAVENIVIRVIRHQERE